MFRRVTYFLAVSLVLVGSFFILPGLAVEDLPLFWGEFSFFLTSVLVAEDLPLDRLDSFFLFSVSVEEELSLFDEVLSSDETLRLGLCFLTTSVYPSSDSARYWINKKKVPIDYT